MAIWEPGCRFKADAVAEFLFCLLEADCSGAQNCIISSINSSPIGKGGSGAAIAKIPIIITSQLFYKVNPV